MTEEYIKSVLAVTDHPEAAGADPKSSLTIGFSKSYKKVDLLKNCMASDNGPKTRRREI